MSEGMKCCACGCSVPRADYIAIDDNGDLIYLCEECYNKVKQFFRR